MRRIISVALAVLLALVLFPSSVTPADAAAITEPKVEIRENKLYYNGKNMTLIESLQTFKVYYLSKSDRGKVTKAYLDQHPQWPVYVTEVYIQPHNVQQTYKAGVTEIELNVGDVLFFSTKERGNVKASPFTEIVLTEEMFALTTTPSADLLPALSIEEGKLKIKPKNRLTKYEYAVIPASVPADFYPDWIQVGSAAASGGDAISAPLQPRSVAHSIRVRVQGDTVGHTKSIDGVKVADPVLSIELELIGPLSGGDKGCYWYLSQDGGKRFQKLFVAAGQDGYFSLSKIFGNKQVDLVLRKSAEDVIPEEIKSNVLRRTVNPRADFSKEYKAKAFVSESYPENWTLSGLTYSTVIEYRVVGTQNWLRFPNATGLPLLLESEQNMKKKQAKYEFRVAANAAAYIPASKPKKISQPKQIKSPKVKLDYKKEIVKLKAGMMYALGDSPDKKYGELNFNYSFGELDVSGAITNGQTIYFYTAETEKKSRSPIVSITPAPRSETPDSDEGLKLEKGKAKLIKGFEVYGSKEKWGSMNKGDSSVLVRRKATAKYNAKTGKTTGEAASLAIEAKLTYTSDGKTVTEIKAPGKKNLVPKSLYLKSSRNCTVNGYDGFNMNVLREDIFEYTVNMITARSSSGSQYTCDFYMNVNELGYDGDSPLKSVALAKNGTLINENTWSNLIKDARLGDEYTFTLYPVDRNTYRETVYRITITEPILAAPSSVSWRSPPDGGKLTVSLKNALALGDSIKLRVQLKKGSGDDFKTVLDETKSYVNLEKPSGMSSVEIDLSNTLASSGVGSYRVYVNAVGSTGVSKDSIEIGSYLLLTYDMLKLSYVSVSSDITLQKGAVASVDRMCDYLGNAVGGSVQWVTSDTKPSNSDPGTAIQGATSKSFTVTAACEGKYLGARVIADGSVITSWFDTPVKNTVSINAPASPVTITGSGELEFTVNGLAHVLTAASPSSSNISVSLKLDSGQDAAVFGGLIISGNTVRVPVTASGNGDARVALVLNIGKDLTGYLNTGEITGPYVTVTARLP